MTNQEKLAALREKNPGLEIHCVCEPAFHDYGRVIDFDAGELIAACEQACAMPASGSAYKPAIAELEEAGYQRVQRELRGEGLCEIGCCWGYNTMLNALEYHRASEHNIAVTDMLLLLAKQGDLQGFDLPQGKVVGFFVPRGTTIEVYATTLHYCPCQTEDTGFRCIVVLPRGTNEDLTAPRSDVGDGRILWAKDKWLIAHEDNAALVSKGAYPGLHGVNFDVKY